MGGSLAVEISIYLLIYFSLPGVYLLYLSSFGALCNCGVDYQIENKWIFLWWGYCDAIVRMKSIRPHSHGTTQYYIKLSCGKYQIDADVMQSIVIAINSFLVLIIINLVSIDYNYSWSHHSGNCTNCKHYRSNILMRLITITTWISLLVTISLPPSSLQLPTQMA